MLYILLNVSMRNERMLLFHMYYEKVINVI